MQTLVDTSALKNNAVLRGDWNVSAGASSSTDQLLQSIPDLSFEESRILWSNGELLPSASQDVEIPKHPSSPWEVPSQHTTPQSIPNRHEKLGGIFHDSGLADVGLLMSPGSKDMAALGMQMVDQVLSNSPGTGGMLSNFT